MHEIPVALAHAFRDLEAAARELEQALTPMGDRGVEISAPRLRDALAKLDEVS